VELQDVLTEVDGSLDSLIVELEGQDIPSSCYSCLLRACIAIGMLRAISDPGLNKHRMMEEKEVTDCQS